MKENQKYYNIQMAAQISGVSAHTIRAWEKRYQALTPDRTETGRRQYSQTEVDRLGLLAQLTSLGSSIGQIANLYDATLRTLLQKLSHQPGFVSQIAARERIHLNPEDQINKIFQLLKSYKIDELNLELEKSANSFPPRQLCLKILNPIIQYTLHNTSSELTTGQIQTLWAMLKFHLGKMIYRQSTGQINQNIRITLASAENEHFEVELLMIALLCSAHQMQFYYLGTSMPANALSEAAKAVQSNIMLVSFDTENEAKREQQRLNYIQSLEHDQLARIWIYSHSEIKGLKKTASHEFQVFNNIEAIDKALNLLQ